METIQFIINKLKVYDEVAKTTSYIGSRMEEGAYLRIFTTDEDRTMLERFWIESADTANEQLKRYIMDVNDNESGEYDLANDYQVTLEVSSRYDTAFTNSISNSLFNYFVNNILCKWFFITNKEEASAYATNATAMMDDVKRKLAYKRKPTRIIPM